MNQTAPKLKVLFVGDMWYGSNARSLRDGFEILGYEVFTVDTSPLTKPTRLSPGWIYKTFQHDKRLPSTSNAIEAQIQDCVRNIKPDLLFVFKGIHIRQSFLMDLPVRLKVHYSPDDVSNPENLSDDYLKFESLWDAVVTTKSFNISELVARGVKKPIHVWSAYDPKLHYIASYPSTHKYDIGFVGNRRSDRRGLIREVAQEFRGSFYLAGPGWWKDSASLMARSNVVPRFAKYGDSFSNSISEIAVNLVLLNSDNRDLHTCRSFEVPAAGGLVLAKRTVEHEELFEDMKSAALFDSTEELIEKAEFLIKNSNQAESVRKLGHISIVEKHHTYKDRAAEILREIEC
jgi:hypothetical protein